MKHTYRLVDKIRNHRDLIVQSELTHLDDDPPLVAVRYGSPSRVVRSAVKAARARGLKVGAIRLKSLCPFQDHLFERHRTHLVVELNLDGQLVREVQRASGGEVHFLGRCGELPAISELLNDFSDLIQGRPLARKPFEREAW
ncbi:MAG: hypothetical protein LBT47_13770 [Deltaproteobacteria bacterium]|jgi:2-oxoglutarate ferredoxin oxidoreductase subunit alpha|nr:hypothetical protein [Deltaproteobacteria bacterium]